MSHDFFETLDWVRTTNVYEVNLRQYTEEGNFLAFSRELPRLKDMGVEVLWFMPVTPIAQQNRKGSLGSYYASADFYTTNPEYGSIDDFKLLVEKAHALEMKVIIDWVANHTGWGHTWTQSNPDYYKKNEKGEFYDQHGWDDVIDLDFSNANMRADLIQAMKFWVTETGIDGFRCDMAMLVPLDFWKEARKELDNEKKLFWLAECEESNYHEAFDATYTWQWMHKTADFCKGHTDIHGLDNQLWKYNHHFHHHAIRLYFTTNHDENSWNGTEYEKYGEAAESFAVFSATWNGMPLIYSGQELPNRKRLKFFDKDAINWNGNVELHDFYKTLLLLRKQNPALRAGDPAVSTRRIRTTEDDKIFAYQRKNGENEVLVLLNLSPFGGFEFSIMDERIQGSFKDAFHPSAEEALSVNRPIQIEACGYRVLYK